MPITVDWFPEPYIRRSIITGVIKASEIETWVQAELATLNGYPHTIHFIMEGGGSLDMKTNMVRMNSVKTFLQHSNTGWIALLDVTPLISFGSLILQRVAGMRFMPFESTEKAQAYLLELVRIAQENEREADAPLG